MYFIFDTVDSSTDRLDWFTQARIIESSYEDIEDNDIGRFDLAGYVVINF